MAVTEFGFMGVKPNFDVMNDSTREGQVLTGAWNAVTTAPGGPQRVHWGLEIEDPSRIWAFFDWDSLEQHEEFARTSGIEATKPFPEFFTPGFTKHITFSPHPPSVLKSPVTEVMFAFFSADISRADQDAAEAQFQSFADRALAQCSDVVGVSAGWGVEKDFPVRGGEEGQKGTLFTALIGWPSIDAHMKFRETDVFKDNVGLLRNLGGLVKLTMFHVSCRTLERSRD